MKKYKISFVNKGKEFELPDISIIGFYKSLLEIQARVETKYKGIDKESIHYKKLVATESNINTAFFVLNGIDSNVTKKDIEEMKGEELADFIIALYDIDFPKGEKQKETPKQQINN